MQETCRNHYDDVCKGEFADIGQKLDRLDETIRGNGRPGLQSRLSRLEDADKTRRKVLWLLIGATAALAVKGIWAIVEGGYFG